MNHQNTNDLPFSPDCFQRLACRYALRQIRTLKTCFQRIRRTADARCLHQSRVACRRLRAALNMLPADPFGKKWKKWKKNIRRIARDLGQARDKDVEIKFLREFLKQTRTSPYRPAISRMLLRDRQERNTLQPHVVQAVRNFKKKAVLNSLQEKLKNLSSKSAPAFPQNPEPLIGLTIPSPVLAKLEAFLAFETCLRDPRDIRRHHQMRIAAKRLRYTMEICAPLYGRTWTSRLNQMKNLQTRLGEIRDCDVRLEKIDAFLRDERQRTIAYFGRARSLAELQPGMENLRERLQTLRQARFASLVRLWQRLRRQRFWENLARTAEHPLAKKPGLLPRTQSLALQTKRG